MRYQGLELGAWDREEAVVWAQCRVLGIPSEAAGKIGRAFLCILPGHEEIHASASLYRRNDGMVVYRDWHVASGEKWYWLPEVRASLSYSRAVKLRPPEMAVCHLRLLSECGLLDLARVDAPLLPSDVRPSVRKVYEGFLLLLGCKWLHTPAEPTAFAWRFASAWCGITERHAGEAVQELLRLGLIRFVGRSHDLAVFLPGTGR